MPTTNGNGGLWKTIAVLLLSAIGVVCLYFANSNEQAHSAIQTELGTKLKVERFVEFKNEYHRDVEKIERKLEKIHEDINKIAR